MSRLVLLCAFVCLASMTAPASAVVTVTTVYALQQDQVAVNDSVQANNVVVSGVDTKASSYGVYIQEIAGGQYSGILAFASSTFPAYTPPSTTPAVGDLVSVRGRYSDFSGLAAERSSSVPRGSPSTFPASVT